MTKAYKQTCIHTHTHVYAGICVNAYGYACL